MNRLRFLFRFLLRFAAVGASLARGNAADAPTRRSWTIDDVVREALIYVPARAKTSAVPVVFAFHGHGGTMAHSALTSPFYQLWPDTIVVYPQGLNTPGRLSDPEGKKTGWQHGLGAEGDRDLKFFDTMLASLRSDYRVDSRRVYATGHSNGGAFTYLLWAARGDALAAVAPSAAVANRQLLGRFKPKPALHIAGEKDPLVKFEWQQRTIEALKKLNRCGPGEPWEKYHTLYPSKLGMPLVTVIHPGTHTYLSEAPALIVKFFQQHPESLNSLPPAPAPSFRSW